MSTMTKKFASRSTRTTIAMALCMLGFLFAVALPQTAWAALTPNYTWYTSNPNASTFTISTPAQWLGFVELVNGTAGDIDGDGKADAPRDFAGKTVKLSNTITSLNFQGEKVKPAGGQNGTVFAGVFDGNNIPFSQFTIDTSHITAKSIENVGLIGATTKTSTVKNVATGSSAVVRIEQSKGGKAVSNVGLIVGKAGGSVENCFVGASGSVTITSHVEQTETLNFPICNVGCIAGIVLGNVTKCTNEGTLSVSNDTAPRTENSQNALIANVGGIVGCLGTVDSSLLEESGFEGNHVTPDGYDTTHGVLSKCRNEGTIMTETASEAGLDRFGQVVYAQSVNVGGIVGYSRGNVDSCVNAAYVNAPRANGCGGIVGSLRALTPSAGYSGNFSSEGTDDGMFGGTSDAITVSNCTNWGDVQGYVFPGGIVGRAGTHTTIKGCLNGVDETGAVANTYIVAMRWNKPFPAGICGSTYGTICYCANHASVASVESFEHDKKAIVTRSGYYASGIAGNTSRFTDSNMAPTSPLPEIYGNYNVGQVLASGDFRQRALVGDNGGFVHDNLALTGCVSTNDLLYGDDPNESEASGGSSSNNHFASVEVLRADELFDAQARVTSVSLLNTNAAADGWSMYWVKANSTDVNNGYPVLNRQVTWASASIAGATVALSANAEYSGEASIPRATVTLNGVQLVQDADFQVIVDASSVEVTGSSAPYTATVKGVGNYTGTAGTFNYGIGKGDLANCTVAVNTKQYNAKPQTISPEDVTLLNLAGNRVDVNEYSVTIDPNDSNLTNGQAINAKKYQLIITAKSSSTHFYGKNLSGVFNVKPATITVPKDDDLTSGNHGKPDGISCMGTTIGWISLTQNPNITDDELREKGAIFPYTGKPIKPTVTGATLSGTTVDGEIPMVEGVDYRVVYGVTAIDDAARGQVDNIGAKGKVTFGYVMVRYVTGGNFSNYEIMKFLIDGTSSDKLPLSKADIKGTDPIVYEKEAGAYRPVEVWYAGSQLEEGTDYAIKYENNTDVGRASYTITGKGLFEGTVKGTFDIVKGDPYTLLFSFDDKKLEATLVGIQYHGTLSSYKVVIPATVKKTTNAEVDMVSSADGAVVLEPTEDDLVAAAVGDTYTVVAIADEACGSNDRTKLTESEKRIGSVTIPGTVERIGAWAFCTTDISTSDVSNIQQITFEKPSKLTTIGQGAFCQTGITEIIIPASVQLIESSAFARSSNLKKVVFETTSPTIPVIEPNAFRFVYRADAVYDKEKATIVDEYIRGTLASQNWTANGEVLDGGGNGGQKEGPAAWKRLSGDNALITMAKVVREGHFAQGGTVVLASVEGYWDALTAAGIAGLEDAPVVMTWGTSLADEAKELLVELKPTRIIVCGGTGTVDEPTAQAAKAAAGATTLIRAAGDNATLTAVDIFEKGASSNKGWSDTAIIATVGTYHDALAAAPLSYALRMPIFLAQYDWATEKGLLTNEALSAMKSGGIKKAYIAGGSYWISAEVEKQLTDAGITPVRRLFGDNAVETSGQVAAEAVIALGMTPDGMGVATAGDYHDALAGAALCGKGNAVMVLVNDVGSTTISGFTKSNADAVAHGYVFGGQYWIPDELVAELEKATE